MYNYVMLIGRVCQDVEVLNGNGLDYTKITLACQRPFKNNETNQFDTDFIPVTMFDTLCNIAKDRIHKGDLVALKGRLQGNLVELATGPKINALSIICERIALISPYKAKDNKEEEEGL